VVLLLLRANPLEAYAAMFGGALGTSAGLIQSAVKATPLLLVALGIIIAFRANVINIGAEGQIIAGALMATWFALTFRAWPGWLLVTGTLLAGFAAGAAWGFVPGLLKARLGVNEILSTVMMNAVALQLMNVLLSGALIDPAEVLAGTFIAQSERIPQHAWLVRLVPQTLLHAGAIVAVLLAIAVYFFLWRTTVGYRIRAVGQSPEAARYAGMSPRRMIMLTMSLCGAFAGMAGAIEILRLGYYPAVFGTSIGFDGITVALLGQAHPIGILFSGLLLGAMRAGAPLMQIEAHVPVEIIDVIQGVILIFLTAEVVVRRVFRLKAARVEAGELQTITRTYGEKVA